MSNASPGIAPKSVTRTLRMEGLATLAAVVAAYWFLGGNWWLFALLLLAPDLAFFGYAAGDKTGAKIYNLAHTYTVPAVLGAVGWFSGTHLALEIALIWAAHIAMDRAIGYGLKYPGHDGHTHLGLMGKARKLANAG
jgi:hypothetical protein